MQSFIITGSLGVALYNIIVEMLLCSTNDLIVIFFPIVAVGDNMFPLIEREFPFIHVSPSTVCRLRQKQLQQVTALTRPKLGQKTSAVKKMAEMEQKQKALLQIIKKELDHTKRLVSKITRTVSKSNSQPLWTCYC